MQELICNPFFPMKESIKNTNKHSYIKAQKYFKNISIVSLGGNLNNPIKTFINLFKKLRNNNNIALMSTSPIYKNPPFGYIYQHHFYNATIMLATNMCLIEFYGFIFYLERIFGRQRKRAFKNAPRILDIDIIFFNDIVFRSKKLSIPHPHWQHRESVLIPLLYQVNYKGF